MIRTVIAASGLAPISVTRHQRRRAHRWLHHYKHMLHTNTDFVFTLNMFRSFSYWTHCRIMMVIYVVVLDDVDDSESLTMTKEVHKLSFRIKRSVSKVTKQITSTQLQLDDLGWGSESGVSGGQLTVCGVFTPVRLREGMKNRCGEGRETQRDSGRRCVMVLLTHLDGFGVSCRVWRMSAFSLI